MWELTWTAFIFNIYAPKYGGEGEIMFLLSNKVKYPLVSDGALKLQKAKQAIH